MLCVVKDICLMAFHANNNTRAPAISISLYVVYGMNALCALKRDVHHISWEKNPGFGGLRLEWPTVVSPLTTNFLPAHPQV